MKNLQKQHGDTVAYSRLSILCEAGSDYLLLLEELMLEVAQQPGIFKPGQLERLIAESKRFNQAYNDHKDTKKWALSEAPDDGSGD